MDRLTRRCKICNKNYEEDAKLVLDNNTCTTCILNGDDECKELLEKADDIIKEIKQITMEEE